MVSGWSYPGTVPVDVRAPLLRRWYRPAAGSGRWSETQSALRASKESVSGGALRIGRQFPSASRRHRHIHCTPTPPTYTWDSVLHPREKPDGQRRVELHLHGSGFRLPRLRLDDREAREPDVVGERAARLQSVQSSGKYSGAPDEG